MAEHAHSHLHGDADAGHAHHAHHGGHGHHQHHHHGPGGHDHAAGADARALIVALALTAGVLVAELIGAWRFNSLALLSDAAHMMTDLAALAIALMAVRIGAKAADDRAVSAIRGSRSWRRHSTRCCCSRPPPMS